MDSGHFEPLASLRGCGAADPLALATRLDVSAQLLSPHFCVDGLRFRVGVLLEISCRPATRCFVACHFERFKATVKA